MLRSVAVGAAALSIPLAVVALAAEGTNVGAPGRAGAAAPGEIGEANRLARARMDAFQERQQRVAERVIRSICIGCLPVLRAGAEPAATVPPPPPSVAALPRATTDAAPRRLAATLRPRRHPALDRLKRILLARLMSPDDEE